jgi:hypothetical protein
MWERRARKCIKVGWRTIEPPEMIDYGAFTEVWTAIEKKLRANPGVQVGRLLDGLIVEYPGKFRRSQLRTLQRYVRDWLFLYGPDKEVFFQQKDGTVI